MLKLRPYFDRRSFWVGARLAIDFNIDAHALMVQPLPMVGVRIWRHDMKFARMAEEVRLVEEVSRVVDAHLRPLRDAIARLRVETGLDTDDDGRGFKDDSKLIARIRGIEESISSGRAINEDPRIDSLCRRADTVEQTLRRQGESIIRMQDESDADGEERASLLKRLRRDFQRKAKAITDAKLAEDFARIAKKYSGAKNGVRRGEDDRRS